MTPLKYRPPSIPYEYKMTVEVVAYLSQTAKNQIVEKALFSYLLMQLENFEEKSKSNPTSRFVQYHEEILEELQRLKKLGKNEQKEALTICP